MRDIQSDIEAKGAHLIIVGNGRPEHARDFAEQARLEGAVYTDPSRSLYRTLGMKRSLASTFNGGAVKNALRAWKKGHRQTATKGDPWQQGGTLVVSQQGELLYGHVSEAGGDNAPVSEILAALG